MLNISTQTPLCHTSGEELLMLAILGPPHLKPKIDRELDRRALADVVNTWATLPNPFTANSGHAA